MKRTLAAFAVVAAMGLHAPAAVAQVADKDPALQQQVSADENIAPAGERTVISQGHADLGAMFVGEKLEFLVRDDSQVPPVWRHLDDVVFDVGDEAIQTLPETGDFDFTGAGPGEEVWVIPQTEITGVPWLGWNTQAPALLDRASAGVSMEFGGHDGEGDFTLFIQPGGFHQPQQLWNSQLEGAQPMWVEPNPHTHANWVFTDPGVHLVGVRAVVKDNAGQVHTAEEVVHLAVGEGTDVNAAFERDFAPADPSAGGVDSKLIAIITAVAVVVIVAVLAAVAALRSRSRSGRQS